MGSPLSNLTYFTDWLDELFGDTCIFPFTGLLSSKSGRVSQNSMSSMSFFLSKPSNHLNTKLLHRPARIFMPPLICVIGDLIAFTCFNLFFVVLTFIVVEISTIFSFGI